MKVATNGAAKALAVSDDAWMEMLEELTQRYFNMSVAEFGKRLERGEFGDLDDPRNRDVLRIAMLMPRGWTEPERSRR